MVCDDWVKSKLLLSELKLKLSPILINLSNISYIKWKDRDTDFKILNFYENHHNEALIYSAYKRRAQEDAFFSFLPEQEAQTLFLYVSHHRTAVYLKVHKRNKGTLFQVQGSY